MSGCSNSCKCFSTKLSDWLNTNNIVHLALFEMMRGKMSRRLKGKLRYNNLPYLAWIYVIVPDPALSGGDQWRRPDRAAYAPPRPAPRPTPVPWFRLRWLESLSRFRDLLDYGGSPSYRGFSAINRWTWSAGTILLQQRKTCTKKEANTRRSRTKGSQAKPGPSCVWSSADPWTLRFWETQPWPSLTRPG